MTVLLMLLFIIAALTADAIVQWNHKTHFVANAIRETKYYAYRAKGVIQEVFVHDGDLLPTMADGGQKLEKKKEEEKKEEKK